MAIPVLRASLLLTGSAVAVGAALYETHEPFRTWADDVKGRAEAAWVGLKADFDDFKQEMEGHARNRRQRHAHAYGGRAGQWEGWGSGNDVEVEGPFRRRRRGTRKDEEREGEDVRMGDDTNAETTGVEREGGGAVKRRRGSEGRIEDVETERDRLAQSVLAEEGILDTGESYHDAQPKLHSRASTETLGSVDEVNPLSAVMTPTTASSETMDDDTRSMSVISAPSEMEEVQPHEMQEILTPTESRSMTPIGSGVMTPVSSSADELLDFDELRRDGMEVSDGGDIGMDDTRSESVASEWSAVSAMSEMEGVR